MTLKSMAIYLLNWSVVSDFFVRTLGHCKNMLEMPPLNGTFKTENEARRRRTMCWIIIEDRILISCSVGLSGHSDLRVIPILPCPFLIPDACVLVSLSCPCNRVSRSQFSPRTERRERGKRALHSMARPTLFSLHTLSGLPLAPKNLELNKRRRRELEKKFFSNFPTGGFTLLSHSN